jgi:hypothetical protein
MLNIDQNIIPDTSVHCLHIVRVITDDAILKTYAREYYDYILFTIIDGLNQPNWSIKNACMLLFSRLVKNSFMLDKKSDRNAPTFVEYFANKDDFRNKFFNIFEKEIHTSSDSNSTIIMLVNFICKFKKSKAIEIQDSELQKLVGILFKLGFKKNKIFRKLLSNSLGVLCGSNISIIYDILLKELNKDDNDNNTLDFLFNMVDEIVRQEIVEENLAEMKEKEQNKINFLGNLTKVLNEVYIRHRSSKNYFVMNKIVKLNIKLNVQQTDDLISINDDDEVDFRAISDCLEANTKVPFFYKYIKNTIIALLANKPNLKLINFSLSLINPTNEELLVYLLKKHPEFILSKNILDPLLNESSQLNTLSVNVSSRIIEHITKLITNNQYPIKDAIQFMKDIISIFKLNKSATKLIDKLFIIIGKVFRLINDNNILNEVLAIILTYCQSGNEEKIRYNSICCFEDMLNTLSGGVLTKRLFPVLKIFILILNDEHPEIRNIAAKLLTNMLRHHYPNLIKITPEMIYSSEYLSRKLLLIKLDKNVDYHSYIEMLYDYLVKNNLYFLHNMHLNNENKVFFYEPDNKYIDNIEIKLSIMENRISTQILPNNVNNEVTLPNVKILIMLESFTQYITDNFYNISLAGGGTIDIKDNLMNSIRKHIYNY